MRDQNRLRTSEGIAIFPRLAEPLSGNKERHETNDLFRRREKPIHKTPEGSGGKEIAGTLNIDFRTALG